MAFIAGAGATNVDLLYQGMERIPDVGEELYCKDFDLQLGGGLPATLINLADSELKPKLPRNSELTSFRNLPRTNFYKTALNRQIFMRAIKFRSISHRQLYYLRTEHFLHTAKVLLKLTIMQKKSFFK